VSDLLPLAYHGSGEWTVWLGHVALSAAIHALIYSVIFRLMHDLTLGQVVFLVIVIMAVLFLWARSRDRRGW
jgi:hypothetical protein